MLTVETRHAIDPATAKGLDTAGLRAHFHAGGLFADGEVRLVYTHYDRLILGGAVPAGGTLTLDHVKECGTESILDRREMGILNIGEAGTVSAAGTDYTVGNGEVLFLGMGSGPVTFSGNGRFYVLSAPAHRACPSRLIRVADARRVEMGSAATSNERVILQFLHPEVAESCQLLMGYTQFAPGSVWNTMPAHLHDRRMEAYLYFELGPDQRVFHIMGQPDETRHIVMANEDAVISPPWSIHCGAGTGAYTFCWAMAGDNVDFTDMDMVAMGDLR
ncbi:MAG: 5-dehydro-4-deoxy-D-glucuronate isomerase [Hoeflea sp.]|uniref:5-dehydro-4-deoxy-D-glucuronate isomerase n=1 Tax=Hoeflea sp. TaxID=1940281 RepID=UPI001D727C6B|nr:5-dehydro-4-deoxy-D-glucuronate isomerase [Hoeflea sp.]MBU4527382.1 5-dehydro-4-deoxy-D-glucuronate isomerase [Alphaproteobacteria bacterium]MBU4546835.1 5-dehydro-4-deoxy-D-glucuronate isomerase [Alphaproteobacteria bacterium]MBU4551653.1 5-dehydro-4-deoxy-D-glucuronate isomerase [Alphaproteobacteria bacterium]MBV1725658.1 5-dehydro-4-deoxy-D-glucuronate isomerase [Hoeflea sp.]MBV1759706.1 5-dehydro-4-deoxy-D-glucuronate isomerase [Hoeflea sp.]